MNDYLQWIWLSEKCPKDSPLFIRLISYFGSCEKIYTSKLEELSLVHGITRNQAAALCDKSLDRASDIYKRCKILNIGIVTYGDELYPDRLRKIKNPPVLLYYKGKLPLFDSELCIGMVGTRTPSSYGCRIAYEIGFDLSSCGAYVISGMALGIDAVSHTSALDAGGRTVAILGGGVDNIYPSENTALYHRLEANATIMSEYAPGTRPTRFSFPQRNRIISGLSEGTVIVEAKIKSGAMITAEKAKEQGRQIFAVPGRVGDMNSEGPNHLIASGAKQAYSADSILREYEFLYPDKIHMPSSQKSNPYTSSGEPINFSSRNSLNDGFARRESKGSLLNKKDTEHNKSNAEKHFEHAAKLPTEEKVIARSSFDGLDSVSKTICESLSYDSPKSFEEILTSTKISASDTMSALTILEIQGIVKAMPGGNYILA